MNLMHRNRLINLVSNLRVDEGGFDAEDHFELHDIQVLKGPNNISYCGVALIDGGDGAIRSFNKADS